MPQQESMKNIKNIQGFQHKTILTITQGTVLVKLNKFTGDIKVTKTSGLKVSLLPWISHRVYSSMPQQLNTPPSSAYTKDDMGGQGPKINYDTDYMYKIVNPVQFSKMELSESAKNNSKSTVTIIGERLDNIVRGYISKKTIQQFIGQGNIDILSECRSELANIERDYGVQLTEMMITKIQMPKEISEQLEKNQKEKLKIEEEEYSKQSRIIKAEGDAEVKKINASADALKIQKIIQSSLLATRQAGGNVDDMCRAIGQALVNEGLVNGSNPNTTVIATNAVNYACQQSMTNGAIDPNTFASMILGSLATMNHNANNNPVNNQPSQKPDIVDVNPVTNDDPLNNVDWIRYLKDPDYFDYVESLKNGQNEHNDEGKSR